MPPHVEFCLSSPWGWKPKGVAYVVDRLSTLCPPGARFGFDADFSFFEVVCLPQDEDIISRIFKDILDDIEKTFTNRPLDSSIELKRTPENQFIEYLPKHKTIKLVQGCLREYGLPSIIMEFLFQDVWAQLDIESETMAIQDFLTQDDIAFIEKRHGVVLSCDRSGKLVYIGANMRAAIDHTLKNLDNFLAVKKIGDPRPIHVLSDESYSDPFGHGFTVDVRYIGNINPELPKTVLFDRYTVEPNVYSDLPWMISLRLCPFDKDRHYNTSLAGYEIKPLHDRAGREPYNCDSKGRSGKGRSFADRQWVHGPPHEHNEGLMATALSTSQACQASLTSMPESELRMTPALICHGGMDIRTGSLLVASSTGSRVLEATGDFSENDTPTDKQTYLLDLMTLDNSYPVVPSDSQADSSQPPVTNRMNQIVDETEAVAQNKSQHEVTKGRLSALIDETREERIPHGDSPIPWNLLKGPPYASRGPLITNLQAKSTPEQSNGPRNEGSDDSGKTDTSYMKEVGRATPSGVLKRKTAQILSWAEIVACAKSDHRAIEEARRVPKPGQLHSAPRLTCEVKERQETYSSQFSAEMEGALAALVAKAPYLTGKVTLRAELGRILLRGLDESALAFNPCGTRSSGWQKAILASRLHECKGTLFTKILTTDSFDVEHMTKITGSSDEDQPLWLPRPTKRTTFLFACTGRTSSVEPTFEENGFNVQISNEEGGASYTLSKRYEEPPASIWVHTLWRNWDMRVALSHSNTRELERKFGAFARSLAVNLQIVLEDEPVLTWAIHQDFPCRVEYVRTLTEWRFTSPDGASKLDVTEVLENEMRPCATPPDLPDTGRWFAQVAAPRSRSVRTGLENDGWTSRWYEASVSSTAVETALQKNEALVPGDRAGWDMAIVKDEGALDAILAPATRMLQEMDSIGARNNNNQDGRMGMDFPGYMPEPAREEPQKAAKMFW